MKLKEKTIRTTVNTLNHLSVIIKSVETIEIWKEEEEN